MILNCKLLHGNVCAQLQLALSYSAGDGLEQNKTLARMWYMISAMNGYELARFVILNILRKMSSDQIKELEI